MRSAKSWMKSWMAAILAAGCAVATARGETETVDGIQWRYEVYDGEATIASGSIPFSTTGAISIPSTLGGNGYLVTSIGDYAFQGCSGLTSVGIPDSVTSIGKEAFWGCSGLTSVTIPASVTSIGYRAFSGCSGLREVTIPDNVTSIGSFAFGGCSSLWKVTILGNVTNDWVDGDYSGGPFHYCTNISTLVLGEKVTKIGNSMFSGFSGLTSVVIGDSVANIGNKAFYGCSGLTSVVIPDSVANIEEGAFSGCASALFDTNTIPGVRLVDGWAVDNSGTLIGILDLTDVRGIAHDAFSGCNDLTSVMIGDSVRSIGSGAFSHCSGLMSVLIDDGVASIGSGAFSNCWSLTNVAIPDSVTNIGSGAFSWCSGLTSVAIGDSVASIGSGAFSNCWSLTNATIPDSVTSIGDSAFSRCSGLMSVTIPDSVTNIGQWAFYRCGALRSVAIPASVCESTTLSNLFPAAYRKISEMTISGSVTKIGRSAFNGCTNLAMVDVHDLAAWCAVSFAPSENPLSYAHHLFHDGEEVTDLVIPNGVADIGIKVFPDCSALTSVTIPESVTNIGACAFSNCYNLKGVAIPDSVKSIGSCAFEDCKGLGAFSIGKGLETIGEGTANSYSCHATFGNAYTLTAFSVDPENPHFKSVNGVLYTKDGKELVAFPAGCRGEFAVPNGVEKIWIGAFCGAYDLKLLIIPDSVMEIGNGVLYGCSSLANIYLPARFRGNESAFFAGSTSGHTFIYGRPVERTLALDGQGGIVETVTIHPTYCEAMPKVSVPTREGYRFGGYFSEPNGGGVQYYTAKGESCRTWDSLTVTTLYALWLEKTDSLPEAGDEATVASVLAGAADGRLKERIGSVAEYGAFRAWVSAKGLDAEAVLASPHAWISYALGADGLFENEPTIQIGGVAIALEVRVIVNDGEREVLVDADKVAGMFEATGDAGDWNGTGRLPASVMQTSVDGTAMQFKVVPGDGTAGAAFLRIAP